MMMFDHQWSFPESQVMRRSSSSSTLDTDIADIPLELVNSVEAGMVLEFRGEYARKASMEKRKMSKRLEHEALAYFDECVSISTFDDSDFSSLEDPLSNIIGTAEQHGNKVKLPGGSASVSINPCPYPVQISISKTFGGLDCR